MKPYRFLWIPCVFAILCLFSCGGEVPVPGPAPTVTIEGSLEVAEDFYIRNKPEPVIVEYGVILRDESGTMGEACEMIIDVRLDLFRFDAETQEFVFEQTLVESTPVTVVCDIQYSGSTNWVYDRQASAATYKIVLETTMGETAYSVESDLFVIWKSPGAPKGHAKRDLKKIDQVEKLITKLGAYHEVYVAAKNDELIIGDELVVIHGEIMTVDEAVDMADDHMLHAIENSDQAMAYFADQDYETSFTMAKRAAREAHRALTIYHVLLAQAIEAME